jgi:hypothetical protein
MNQSFQNEIPIVLKKYPNLNIRNKNGRDFLKGILDVSDENGDIVGSFSVEIHSTQKFPYRFPKLYEVGGDIPNHPDWHKYNDTSCCLTVEQDEIIKCKYGITILQFIDDIAIPYFANQLYRKREGRYLNEYPHGLAGFKVFYVGLFKSDDVSLWLKCCESTFIKCKARRNDKCYCNSGRKFKNCHLPVEEKLQILGRDKVLTDIKTITT